MFETIFLFSLLLIAFIIGFIGMKKELMTMVLLAMIIAIGEVILTITFLSI
ncbi:hypothetical protein CPT_Machias_026 [Staphylococcus phage Machias]|nr:hypothetical protein CPT_Machias_026 [Staphylococcus phage Machias]WPH64149.1 hypothetical protein [Staphylococcus phage vB_StaM_PB50]